MKIKNFSTGIFSENRKRIREFYQKNSGIKLGMSILPTVWLVLFLVCPLLIVLKISISESVFSIPPFSEVCSNLEDFVFEIKLNFKNYAKLLEDSFYVKAFFNSVCIAFVSAILCCTIGFPIAYGIHEARPNVRTILLLLVSLSFWSSFLIRVYSWMNLLSINGFVNSILLKIGIISEPIQFIGNYYAICLGLVFCYLPFMIFPIYSILEKVDKTHIEAALDLGCNPTRTFWTITFPLAKPGIISGCTLVFATSIGEFVIPELLGGADTITLGRIIWSEFFTNLDWPMACAISISLMILIILPIFLFQRKDK